MDTPMAKVMSVSFLLALWILFFYFDSGWFMSLLLIAPMTVLVGMALTFILEEILEPLLRWFNK
jgi:hypothetical protein